MPYLVPHKFIDDVEHKRCGSCKEYKILTVFGNDKNAWDKLAWRCLSCSAARSRRYRKENPEKIKNSRRKYQKANAEKFRVNNRKYRKENPEKCRNAGRKSHQKRKRDGKVKAYMKKRYHTDVFYRLRNILGGRLRRALKAQGVYKTTTTMKLCGCSLEKLKQHLESQFTDGMSWDNKGEWHIDHIKPCAAFDLTDVEEQKKCFHYTNLQPLWALDNIRKGAKY